MCDVDEQLRKLVEILSIALRCGNLTRDQSDLTQNIQSALMTVVGVVGDKGNVGSSSASNFSGNSSSVNNNNNTPSIFTFLQHFVKIGPLDDNSTNIPLIHGGSDSSFSSSYNYSDNNFSLSTGDMRMATTFSTTSTVLTTPVPPTLKLHRLEIIKVVVLIIVISIILLTTCRMIFQLFLRYKPEPLK